jgi:hypothetical protein
VIAFGGSGVVIASQAGHMLPPQPPQQTKCRRPPRWPGNTPAASTAACSPAAPATRSCPGAPGAILTCSASSLSRATGR